MSNSTEVKSNRERYAERLKTKYPEKEYADDEAMFAQINDDYDQFDTDLESYKNREKTFSDLFTNNPQSAAFLTDWRNGGDPIVSMLRRFGDDFKAALEDPEKLEVIAAANKEYADRIAKSKDFEDQYNANIQKSIEAIEQMKESESLSDDDIDEAMEHLQTIMADALVGKFSPESIRMALKATRHDEDVALADREGEVRGKNTTVREKLRKPTSDGAPNLSGKNGGGKSPAREMPDLGAIDRDYGSPDIFERGGEKRTPVRRH